MKRATTVHISNRLFSIEEEALTILEDYLSQLRKFFEKQESGNEIYNDIESHVADTLSHKMNATKSKICLSSEDIHEMINTVGLPSEFESQAYEDQQEKKNQNFTSTPYTDRREWSKSATNIKVNGVAAGLANYLSVDPIWMRLGFVYTAFLGGLGLLVYIILAIVLPREKGVSTIVYKKVYRLGNNAVIAGVCAGLASYFKIPIYLMRLLFIMPIVAQLFFDIELVDVSSYPLSGFLAVSYIIIWALVPVAKSSADKLRMKGVRATVDNIKEEVRKNLLQPTSTINKFWKVISYIFMGVGILIGVVILLPLIAVFCSVLFLPFLYGDMLGHAVDFLHYLAFSEWQSYAILLAVFLIIIIPFLILCIWILSLVFRWSTSKFVYLYALLLWFVSIFYLGACVLYTATQFDAKSEFSERFVLESLKSDDIQLIVRGATLSSPHPLEHFVDDDEEAKFPWFISDTAFHWENVRLRIREGDKPYYELQKMITSRGTNSSAAYESAQRVGVSFALEGDSLVLSSTSSVPQNTLFRNQKVYLTLFVPVGASVTTNETIKLLENHLAPNVTYQNREGILYKQYHF